MKTEFWGRYFRISAFSTSSFFSLERNFYLFMQRWFLNSFEIVLQPALYFLAFGLGLQQWIGSIDGVTYDKFVMQGLLMATAMSTSLYESGQGIYQRYLTGQNYLLLRTCPVRMEQVLFGEWLWSVFRSLLACSLLLLFASSFSVIPAIDYFPILSLCLWLAVIFSSLGLLLVSRLQSLAQVYHYASLFIIPQFLFCGVFYPIERLPEPVSHVLQYLPLSMALSWLRGGSSSLLSLGSLATFLLYLLGALVLFNSSSQRIEQQLARKAENR